ncbi:MAG: cell division protein FtsZ [Vibrio sp.]
MFSPEEPLHKIALVGVGGCGHNSIDYVEKVLKDSVDYFIFDTDKRGLHSEGRINRVQIGVETTNGRSAGAIPDVGKAAAIESMPMILDQLKQYDLIFCVGGLGGGTATGVLPEIAKKLHDSEILTLFAMTTAFQFEGKKKARYADEAIQTIVEFGDASLLISNQKMFETLPKSSTLLSAFNCANEVMKESILGICSLIMNTGNINLDYADLRSILQHSGYAVIGKGTGSGHERMQTAMKIALNTPLLEEYDLSSAQRVLVNITAGQDMGLDEVHQAGELIHEKISSDIPIIWGTEITDSTEDEVSVYVILTGVKPENPETKCEINRLDF